MAVSYFDKGTRVFPLACPKCNYTGILFSVWPSCGGCTFGMMINDWPDAILPSKLSEIPTTVEQVKMWNLLVETLSKKVVPVCECNVFLTGCICWEFRKEMESSGRRYNLALRLWEE